MLARRDNRPSDSIPHTGLTGASGAVCTTIEHAIRLDPVPDDFRTTMAAHRRQLLDSALEAIEDVGVPGGDNLKRLVVIVPADLTFRHVTHLCIGVLIRSVCVSRYPA
jgi:hypothetical protein